MSTLRTGLLVSLGVNIFLVAFVLGRLSMPGMMHPPLMPGDAPPTPHGVHSDMPPPFFGPSELFTPAEMRANFDHLQPHFKKMDELRKSFAGQLELGPVSKDEALKHFAQVDAIMTSIHAETREKVAEKISKLTPEERDQFAQHLLKEHHHFEPPADAPKEP